MVMSSLRYTIKPAILTGGRNISKITGEAIVYIRVTIFTDGEKPKTKYCRTHITVKPKDFDKKEGRIKRSDPKASDKNYQIFLQKFNVEQEFKDIKEGKPIAIVNPQYLPMPSKNLIDYLNDYITFRKASKTPHGTLKEFTTLKTRLENFQKYSHQTLFIKDASTNRFSDNFYIFLLQKYNQGTIEKTYTILRTVLNYYYERRDDFEIKMTDTFRNRSWKKGSKSKNEPQPLSDEELEILIKHKFKTHSLNQHKDRFLFQCATGCRFSDMFSISKENIVDSCIEYFPKKTIHKQDNKVIVPLNDLSRSILEKYGYEMRKLGISNQKYNDGLAEMVKELREDHPELFRYTYTSHNGRDSFITIAINSDVDVPTLLKMVGQSSWSVMQRYFKVDKQHMITKIMNIKAFQTTG